KYDLHSVLDQLEAKVAQPASDNNAGGPPVISVRDMDDDFGDFTAVKGSLSSPPDELGDFVTSFGAASMVNHIPTIPDSAKPTFRSKYIRAHRLLMSLTSALTSPPHLVL